MLRTIAERLAHSIVLKRRLPTRFGRRPLFVTPDSALQYVKPDLEKPCADLLAIAEECVQPGMSVWDIGANVGIFTFAAAHRSGAAGNVVAVEADPWLASLIQRSTQLPANRELNVNVLCAAVSDRWGVARFLVAQRGRSSSSLERSAHRGQAGGTRYVQHVPTVTLDGLLESFDAPAFIKTDVEGAESFVLQKAERILSDIRPSFYCEVGAEQKQTVTSIFKNHDYVLFDGESCDRDPRKECSFNTLAVAAEAAESVCGITNRCT